jgi:hypothetical protein
LAAYAEAMTDQLNRIGRIFRGGVVDVPGIPVLMEGSNCPEVIRALADLTCWVPSLALPEMGGCGVMAATAGVVRAKLLWGGEGDEQACYVARHLLPCDLRGNKQRWHSGGLTGLKNGVGP